MKVVYISGFSRSGSTLLDRIFGEMPEFTSIGEFRNISDGRPLATHLCACGRPMSECPFWKDILPGAMEVIGVDAKGLNELCRGTSRQRHLAKLLLERRKGDVHDYARYLYAAYERVIDRSGRPAIVDSSKTPTDALLLGNHPDVELHLVHLVRDPRGPAYSWSRTKADPDKAANALPLYSPAVSSRKWLESNLSVEMCRRTSLGRRYQFVRYEDLMTEPHRILREIVAKLGSDPTTLPLAGDREVELTPSHTASGNPMRYSHGRLEMKTDLRWQTEMSTADRLRATIPALPLLRRYRYPLWVGATEKHPCG
jgi:hypothetical protein